MPSYITKYDKLNLLNFRGFKKKRGESPWDYAAG